MVAGGVGRRPAVVAVLTGLLLASLGVLALVGGAKKKRALVTGDNSEREDEPADSLSLPVDPSYLPYVEDSLSSWLYWWGKPDLPVAGLKKGARLQGLTGDCGGLLWALQVEAGKWPENFPRLFTDDYKPGSRFNQIPDAEIQPGDILVYPRHVALCVGGRGDACTVWSNSGGGKTTLGNNPNARPKLFRGPRYRKDYLYALRLK